MSHNEYTDDFVAGLQWMWGEGFLSPGGEAEVATLLTGVDLTGKHVLDIGFGIGGIDVLLVKKHGAAHVTGIDVEPPLLPQAQAAVDRAGITDQVTFKIVTPGELPFPDASFDVVFSKDSMIHIPDKHAIYAEILRVLKPGGTFVASDWFGSDLPKTPEFTEWMGVIGLTFEMMPIGATAALLTQIGYQNIETVDRNAWYAEEIKAELSTLQGENYAKTEAALGVDNAAKRLHSSSLKQVVVNQGLLRPGHIRAQKPLYTEPLIIVETEEALLVAFVGKPEDWVARYELHKGFPAREWAERMVNAYNARLGKTD